MREQIYLAALLHDIGKFYQRADESGVKNSKLLSAEIKKLETSICPLYKGNYSHKHVLWSAQFFEDFEQLLKPIVAGDGLSYDRLLRLAATHHSPSDVYEQIIQKADHYSSGADRSKEDSEGWKDAAEEEDSNWDAFKRIQMRSVFDAVGNYKSGSKLPIQKLSPDKSLFPNEQGSTYSNHWEQFVNELNLLSNQNIQTFNENLLFLLEKYASRVPASTQHFPDVSLYDHLKTTAAFAISLYDYMKQNGRESLYLPSADEQLFVLVGGDFSGIQQFIYSIIPKGASKNLKGRSFYLQLLVDNIVQLILAKLELFSANVVYASGGGFYILAPNTEKIKKTLEEIELFVSEKLFYEFGTALYLALDYVPFGEINILPTGGGNLSEVWEVLAKKLSEKKSRRFETMLVNKFQSFFEPYPVFPNEEKDAITGDELKEGWKLWENFKVNYTTYQQMRLGALLRSADYWVTSFQAIPYLGEAFEPAALGIYNYFLSEKQLAEKREQLKGSADNVRILRINNTEYLQSTIAGSKNVYGFIWYGGNDYPLNQFGEPKTFEELAGAVMDGENWNGNAKRRYAPELLRIGVLRMDVDNLGNIFKEGFPQHKRSFSRYSTLSRSLDFFFKGYLNFIWSQDEDFSDYTQIIYSGGDDLFIVGKWDVVIRMAAQIQSDFAAWVSNNPAITLSGGMATVGAKFPLLKAATISEQFEKAAKNYSYNGIGKNAFAFVNISNEKAPNEGDLTMALNWQYEMPVLLNLKNKIAFFMQGEDDLSKGFASDMYTLMQKAKFSYSEKEKRYWPQDLSVIWQVAYQFRRSQKKDKEELNRFFKQWATNIMTGRVHEDGEERLTHTRYHALQILAVAARWATLEKRSEIINSAK